jgi:hypothetical protein
MMKKICLFLMAWCYLHNAAAQAPDAAQQAAIDKVTYAVKIVFNKLNNPDWVLRDDYYVPNMMISSQQPGAPFGVNNNYGRVYVLKEGSPTYQKIIQPLLDHKNALAAAKQYDSLSVIDKRIGVLSRFEVYANINMAAVDMHQASKSGTYKALPANGYTYGCRSSSSNLPGAGRTYYYLLFGNWDAAQCASPGHVVSFKFKHPVNTPFIENIYIQIIGDNDVIQNMVNNSDWNIIKNSLTI